MGLSTFLHRDASTPTTLSEIRRIHAEIGTTQFIGLYAYATQSGAALFDLEVGSDFWTVTPSRWLFGIDYGRTQPQALHLMRSRPNVDIRIYDGAYVVSQRGFLPRRDFHAKVAMLMNQQSGRAGMVVGSGNFSSNGLRKSVEAGATVLTLGSEEFHEFINPTFAAAILLWEQATPVSDIIDTYEAQWKSSFSRGTADNSQIIEVAVGEVQTFWIEAGYVTKNRGPDRPGNQIDLPRGMCKYFGFNPPVDLPANSVIGEITFETPLGGPVKRNLRLGNNMMEKITLPTPEAHGIDVYDGKILVFQRVGGIYTLRALEGGDFESAFGDRLAGVRVMNSGRRYGHLL